MRERENSLVNLLCPVSGHLCNHDGHDDWHRELKNQSAQTDDYGIANRPNGIRCDENPLEVLQADPWASHYPQLGIVVLECQEHAVHGGIAEYCQPDQQW